MNFSLLPKIELHLHLDCSLSYDVVKQIDPHISYEQYQQNFVAPSKCTDLADYILRAVNGISLMQTKEQLRLVVFDLFEQLKNDNVLYAEIRFAPLLHTSKGLTPTEVVETVNNATTEAIEQYGIDAGLILCTLRHYAAEQSMETVKLVEAFANTCVVGFDIAADEAGFPIDNHIQAFAYAKEKGIPCTAHAGEARGADSMWETLDHFHPSRIGHGVRCVEDRRLMDVLKQRNIHLEVCPTSNVQTNVVNTIHDHPADTIYRHGISMSINTDARAISPVTLGSEYELLHQLFGWNLSHFYRCNLEAIDHAFCSEAVKEGIRSRIVEAYTAIIP